MRIVAPCTSTLLALAAAAPAVTTAFAPHPTQLLSHRLVAAPSASVGSAVFAASPSSSQNHHDEEAEADDSSATTKMESSPSPVLSKTERNSNNLPSVPTAAAAATAWFAMVQSAAADSPDWGVFEGRTGSLLHPVAMGSLLVFSVSTALLGFQWRRQRTMGDEISALKKSLPSLDGAASVSAALAAAKAAEAVDQSRVNALTAALPVEQQIADLQKERKSLAEAGPRDQHFKQGALLVFVGTSFAIVGPLNTFARAGKLFPGPHLYAGAGLVVLWALAASCVPAMQKGSDQARTVHIGANLAGIGLFAWQVVSGIPILLKVVEKTAWP